MAEKKITVLARFKVKAGQEEQMKQAIMACVAPTRAEPGCINYDLHQSVEDCSDLILYENWRSKEDLAAHLEMPYLQALKAQVEKLCSQPIEITLWEMVSIQA